MQLNRFKNCYPIVISVSTHAIRAKANHNKLFTEGVRLESKLKRVSRQMRRDIEDPCYSV